MRDSQFPEERPMTKYIDTRISVTWLIVSVMAIVSSYIMLQARVGQLSDALTELKQDRATWIASNERIVQELRTMAATDAVQSTRIASLEAEVQSMRRDMSADRRSGR